MIRVLDLTLPTLEENLALDEALLLSAEADEGPEVLRFWEWTTPAVVLGAGSRLTEDICEAACQKDGVPILRRSSGGGTVLLGSGCLIYSLVLAYDRWPGLRGVRASYEAILGLLSDALQCVEPGIEPAGTSDLALSGRKFSGNSQQRKRRHLLHHGTVLYAFDLPAVSRYLRHPVRQPEYRRQRGHDSFLVNLATAKATIKERIQYAWNAQAPLTEWPRKVVASLCSSKYLSPRVVPFGK